MKLHTQTTLILLGTLVLGMVLGALLAGAYARHRLHRLADLRTRGGFARQLERAIQPIDSAQRRAVRRVLRRNAPRLRNTRRHCRRNTRAAVDSLRTDLATILSDQQQERLQRRIGRFSASSRRKRRSME